MRILLFSDVHGEIKNLNELPLKEVDKVICLGDYVDDNPRLNESIDFLRSNDIECYLGNHDALAIGEAEEIYFNPKALENIRKAKKQLNKDNLDWLKTLEFGFENELFACAHANNHDVIYSYINGISESCKALRHLDSKILFYGHTHWAKVFTNGVYENFKGVIHVTDKCLINVPSISSGRDGHAEGYVIFDSKKMTAELVAV